MSVRVRPSGAAAAQYAGYARKLGQGLLRAGRSIKRAVLDGFIFQARRRDERVTVDIIDPPAFIFLPGRPYNNLITTNIYNNSVLELPYGRDCFYAEFNESPYSAEDKLIISSPVNLFSIGSSSGFQYSSGGGLGGDSSLPVKGSWAVTRSFPMLNSSLNISETSYILGKVTKDNCEVAYNILFLSPFINRKVFKKNNDTGSLELSSEYTSTKDDVGYSIVIYDSLIRSLGLLPFCIRDTVSSYPDQAYDFHTYNLQTPWPLAVGEIFYNSNDVKVYRCTACIQVISYMAGDADYQGIKGLWIGTFHISEGVASLVGYQLIDYLSNNNYRPASDSYLHLENYFIPSAPVILESGVYALFTTYATTQRITGETNGSKNKMISEIICLSRTGSLISRTVALETSEGDTGVWSAIEQKWPIPIGGSASEEYALFIFFAPEPEPGINADEQPSKITVVKVLNDGHSSSIIYQGLSSLRPCIPGSDDFRWAFEFGYIMAQYNKDNLYRPNHVCYIGNNKFLFFVSSQYGYPSSGNTAVAQFDVNTGEVQLITVIDEALRAWNELPKPSGFDCVRAEQVDSSGIITQKAVILAFTGQLDDFTQGNVFISRDSGYTWSIIANYGSMLGGRYSGNELQNI